MPSRRVVLQSTFYPNTTGAMKVISMRTIFSALTKELGEQEGKSTFEWYCKTYGVTIADVAPATVSREVLGI